MFLQILPPDAYATTATETVIDNQLLFVVLGLAIGVFAIIKVAKVLSKIKIVKPSFTS
ncbi:MULTISPECIES: hypothetical protein [Polaribacter]|uniref:Uncharacterized protein n=1 Tax=Polaribacter marinaquae TaxID=1642819 RepID=A0ABZ2TPG9_9FLAO|nr:MULTISPECIES: hypothetical protein [unclassified Polaribacter]SHM87764.1 hypothetical protein SAMN05720268_1130 [Polaribacter sp. KT 15]